MTVRLSTGTRNLLNGINTNLVTEGDMTLDVDVQAAYTASGNMTIAGAVSFDSALVMSLKDSTGAGYCYEEITVDPFQWYRLQYKWGKTGTTDSVEVQLGTAADEGSIYTFLTATGAQASLVTAGAGATVDDAFYFLTGDVTSVFLTLGMDGNTDTGYVDDVSLIAQARSFKQIFRDSQIELYTGSQPDSADDEPPGTKLCTITNAGAGITWDDSVAGVLSKNALESWTGTVSPAGTVQWMRVLLPGDDDQDSTTEPRIDMSVGGTGADAEINNASLELNSIQTFNSLTITIPAA